MFNHHTISRLFPGRRVTRATATPMAEVSGRRVAGTRPRVGTAVFLCAALLGTAPSAALAQVLVAPSRVLLGDRSQGGLNRSGTVRVVNRGSEPTTYRVRLINQRMREDGSYEEAGQARPGERFADSFLVFSPRRFTLEPGAYQIVRLFAQAPGGLEPAEYRSHLLVEPVPPAGAGPDVETLGWTGGVGFALRTVVGVSLPVVVRHRLPAEPPEVELTDLAVLAAQQPDTTQVLAVRLRRQGASSTYGVIEATFVPRSGSPVQVGLVRGIAVFTPNAARTVQLPLHPPAGVALRDGSLRVAYRSAEGNEELLAEADLPLY
jgi:P pilus assembly chaperone PapD